MHLITLVRERGPPCIQEVLHSSLKCQLQLVSQRRIDTVETHRQWRHSGEMHRHMHSGHIDTDTVERCIDTVDT